MTSYFQDDGHDVLYVRRSLLHMQKSPPAARYLAERV